MAIQFSLSQLGWKPFFQQQITLDEWDLYTPARVIAQHRSVLEIMSEQGKQSLPLTPSMPALTVGDWLLLDGEGQSYRALERQSLFARRAPGSKVSRQLIAANVDTVFIVSSLNSNFKLNRIERYLALAREAGAEAVVVLTKADCCDQTQHYLEQVRALDPLLAVEALDARDPAGAAALSPWCRAGQTVALLGSSGVGKSTLVNTLAGTPLQQTAPIREADGKGRHTSTARAMHLLASGGILLDTPGMRELQIADCEQGVRDTFADISALEIRCRFNDCSHQSEPGCAVRAALDAGDLDPRRLDNYLKLLREQALNQATLAQKREQARNLSRLYRSVQQHARQRKEGDG